MEWAGATTGPGGGGKGGCSQTRSLHLSLLLVPACPPQRPRSLTHAPLLTSPCCNLASPFRLHPCPLPHLPLPPPPGRPLPGDPSARGAQPLPHPAQRLRRPLGRARARCRAAPPQGRVRRLDTRGPQGGDLPLRPAAGGALRIITPCTSRAKSSRKWQAGAGVVCPPAPRAPGPVHVCCPSTAEHPRPPIPSLHHSGWIEGHALPGQWMHGVDTLSPRLGVRMKCELLLSCLVCLVRDGSHSHSLQRPPEAIATAFLCLFDANGLVHCMRLHVKPLLAG